MTLERETERELELESLVRYHKERAGTAEDRMEKLRKAATELLACLNTEMGTGITAAMANLLALTGNNGGAK